MTNSFLEQTSKVLPSGADRKAAKDLSEKMVSSTAVKSKLTEIARPSITVTSPPSSPTPPALPRASMTTRSRPSTAGSRSGTPTKSNRKSSRRSHSVDISDTSELFTFDLDASSLEPVRNASDKSYLTVPFIPYRNIHRSTARPSSAGVIDKLIRGTTLLPALSKSPSCPHMTEETTCSTETKSTADNLSGHQMMSFYRLWGNSNPNRKLLQHRQLAPPNSLRRSGEFRTCGCRTYHGSSYHSCPHYAR